MKITEDLAYLLGAIDGDGWVEQGETNYRIGLEVKDKDFAENFAQSASKVYGRKPKIQCFTRHFPNGSKLVKKPFSTIKYRVRIGDQKITPMIDELRKNPQFTKILTDSGEACVSAYLRGLYDAEGSFHLSPHLRIYNDDTSLLVRVALLLQFLGINIQSGIVRADNREGVHCLNLYRTKLVQQFSEKIGFSIARKSDKLEAFVRGGQS